MSQGPFVVSFVGPSGAGKTTLIERLIPHLRAAGVRVGTVKHAPHGHDVVDKLGSDSSRHRRAGADAVLLAGASGAVLFLAPDPDVSAGGEHRTPIVDRARLDRLGDLVATHLGHLDVVVAEGFAPLHDALIEVERAGVVPKHTADRTPVWFRVTDNPAGNDVGFDQLDEIARRILERFDAWRPSRT